MKILLGTTNQTIDCNEEYSFKNYTRMSGISIPNGTIVYRSCFSQDNPDTPVFKEGMIGVTFYNCNLDNVLIPVGNIVGAENTQKRFRIQNDLNDWIVDTNNKPIEHFYKRKFEKLGLLVPKPEDIPQQKVDKHIDYTKVAEAEITNK